jgi:sec-independent protein translocase protein TatA
MFRLGPMELVLVLIIVLFLFGAKRLPEMGKGIGEGIKNFKKSIKGGDDNEKHA